MSESPEDKKENLPQKAPHPLKGKKQRRMTEDEWKKAVQLRTETTMSIRDIAKEMGMSYNTLSARFKRYKIQKGSAVARDIEERERAVIDTAKRDSVQLIEKARKMEKQNLDAIQALQTAVIGLVVENQRAGRDPSAMLDGQKALGQTIKNLQLARMTAIEVLEKYDEQGDEDLPILEIRTMTAEDVEAERLRQELEDMEIGDGGQISYDQEDDDDPVVEEKGK